MNENTITHSRNDVSDGGIADRIAQQTLARRGAHYAGEVRALLDAARQVMRRCGTASS